MDQVRRNILLGTGSALAGTVLAAPAASTGAAAKEVTLLSTYVAGTAYHDAARAALRPGDLVVLSREPENDYDPRAIAVRARSGAKLGYVPRIDNQALASLIDSGFNVRARIRQVVADPHQPEIRLDVLLAS